MLPDHLDALPRGATEPRIGGPVRDLEEEEELQLALTILRMNQRIATPGRPRRAR